MLTSTKQSRLESIDSEVESWALTSMQMSLVFQSLHGSAPGNYLQQFVCTSETSVSETTVRQALEIIVRRHVALRLQFRWDSGEVTQTVAETATIPVVPRIWESEESWATFLREDRARGLDLRHAPLARLTLFSGAPRRTCFVITFHHSLLDGRSWRIVMREFLKLLRAEQPLEDLLPPPAPSFTSYLEWMTAQDHARSKPFWREYLLGMPAAAALPLPKPLPDAGVVVRGIQQAGIGESLTAALRSLAAVCGCTLNNVVQAAWAVVLARYTGTEETTFGVTRACRHSPMDGGAVSIVGMLINSVPMRVRIPAGTTTRQLVGWLRNLQLELRDHENTPMTEIFEAAGFAAGEAMYSAYLMFEENGSGTTSEYPGWECELREQTEFLSLSVTAGARIALMLEYDRTLYADASMARVLRDFSEVLQEMQAAPDRDTNAFRAFTPSVSLNPGSAEPGFTDVAEAVAYWSRTTPERPAALSDSAASSYAALESQSNQLAHYLIAAGVSPGSLVGVSIDRSVDLITAFLGIWKAGCAYLPIDLRYPAERRDYMLEDSNAALVLPVLPDFSDQPESRPDVPILSGAPAYVMYTSGSTGKPHGVLISHASLASFCSAIAARYEITSADRVLQASTISFDISVEEIFPTLWRGGTIIPAADGAESSVADFTGFLARWRCTVISLPTAFWHELIIGMKESGRRLPESIRLVVVGGERVLPEVYATWKTLPDGIRLRWLNSYGPTETTVTATVFEPGPGWTGANLPIGRPVNGINTYVLDAQLRPVPVGVCGELYIGGHCVAIGYLNAAELTFARFLPDPFRPGERMYKTGDLARLLDTGDIEFLGRRDFQIKFRGYRIELSAVEAVAEMHPCVSQAIAQTRGTDALLLFVAAGSNDFEGETLRGWLRTKLPEFMVPTAVVVLRKLPLTVNGKIDRDGLSGISGPDGGTSAVRSPGTQLERELTRNWGALFQKSTIGVDDNFFSLGGHSLLAMRMLVQVEKLTGRTIRFADLSRAPTIRLFAKVIEGSAEQRVPDCLVVLREGGTEPPVFCLHGAGGVVHWYNDLAARITDRPVIGVQAPENLGQTLPASVDEMCESYLTAIREIQPRAPYYFLGHSMGGILAYHCAVLCRRRGEAVGFVGSLDGRNVAADDPSVLRKLSRWVHYFWSLDSAGKAEFAAEKMNWLRFEGSQRTALTALHNNEVSLRDEIKANNVRIAKSYAAPPYDGVVHVFRARKRSATEDPDPTLGWSSVAGCVVTADVPGNHYTLLSPPNVDVLAEKLNQSLHSARAIHRS